MSSGIQPLSPLGEEFGKIEYELQVQLNAPRLKVQECYDYSNSHINAQFMTFCKTMQPNNIVNVFVPTTEIQQFLTEVPTKGIKVDPKRGFRFKVGSIDIDRHAETIEVLRVAVALGNTLNYQGISTELEDNDFQSDPPSSVNLRSGYHSLCVSANGDYVVFNSAQIKTCHLVKFAGGKNLEEATSDDDICDLCGVNKATIWCVNDSAKLCHQCDDESHKGNKILSRHKRMNLTDARALMEFCPLHPDTRVEYYCSQCQVPVCLSCKMTGSHSKGSAASHPLVPIRNAYNEALEAAQHPDPVFKRRRQQIEEKIQASEIKLHSIIENAEDVESEIMRIAQQAINHTKQLAGEKALIVRSNKTELVRKLNELDSLSSFIDVHKSSSGPLSFLRAFDRQAMIINSLQGTSDLPLDLTVEPDLTVFGSIDVEATDKPVKSMAKAQTAKNQNPPPQSLRPAPAPKPKQATEKPAPASKPSPPKRKSSIGGKPPVQPKPKKASPPPPPPPPDDYDSSQSDSLVFGSGVEEEEDISSATFVENSSHHVNSPPGSVELTQSMDKYTPQKPKTPLKRASLSGPEVTSLVGLAERREQKNKARGLELNFQPFQESEIITEPGHAIALYLCFPFKAQPRTHLLFSSNRDGRSIQKMHQMIDGIGITAVLVKKEEFIFGGFAAAKWNCDSVPFGEGSSSFLFSVSQDAFIPYAPRMKESCHLYATPDTLTFGRYDLILADNFDGCSAVIENSYSIGFEQGSTEAQTFLAGEKVFRADVVEVWGFFTIEQP